MADLTLRQMLTRGIGGLFANGRRSTYETFGYPAAVTNEQLEQLYLRGGIAHRIINSFATETWDTYPGIRDERGNSSVRDDRNFSPFYEATERLFDEHRVLQCLERADRLSTIGRFGILLMGFNDGARDLRVPLESRPGLKLLYLQPFGQPTLRVEQFDTDPQSKRFGLPALYSAQTNRNSDLGSTTSGAPSIPPVIHHSRVIHIAETMMEDGVNGVPRLLPVYNRLLDLEKLLGGAAEAFWRNADPGLSLSVDKDAQIDNADIVAIKKEAQEMRDKWEKIMVGVGLTPTQLQTAVSDPSPIVDKVLEEIAGAVGIPKRIMVGSERGELSSTQDTSEWGKTITTRRAIFATPSILRPFIDTMIATGNLPPPQGQWWPEWPEMALLDPLTKAQAASTKATALAAYANAPAAQIIVPQAEFRAAFLDLPPEPEYEDEIDLEDLLAEPTPEPTPEQNAAARSLYAYRSVLNSGSVLSWARKQGLKNIVRAEDLHVTVAYSQTPFDWMKIPGPHVTADEGASGSLIIPPGGVRIVEAIGTEGAVALLFTSQAMSWRHDEIVAAGARWPHDSYQPHITVAYGEQDVDFATVEPYRGQIVLGPEIFTSP